MDFSILSTLHQDTGERVSTRKCVEYSTIKKYTELK